MNSADTNPSTRNMFRNFHTRRTSNGKSEISAIFVIKILDEQRDDESKGNTFNFHTLNDAVHVKIENHFIFIPCWQFCIVGESGLRSARSQFEKSRKVDVFLPVCDISDFHFPNFSVSLFR